MIMKPGVLKIAGILCLLLVGCPMAMAQSSRVDLGSVSGAAGALVQVPVYLESIGGAQPAGLQMDIAFDTGVLTFTRTITGAASAAAGKAASSSISPPGSGNLRLIVAGLNQNAIGNGVVALIEFQITTGTPTLISTLTASSVRVTNAQAQAIDSPTGNGLVIVGGGVSNPTEFFFPQIADGGGFVTTMILVNPGNSTATVLLELFSATGTPLLFNLNGNLDNAFSVSLPAKGVLILDSANVNAAVLAGWGRVRSSTPVGGSIRYAFINGTGNVNVVSEAGINPAVLLSNFSLAIDTRRGFLGGLAIANPNAADITLTLTLYNGAGVQLAQRIRTLAGLNYFAELLDQVFPGAPVTNVTGVITVTSAGGQMVGTTLRFSSDFALFSSLPVI